jgi:hypothetical protein
MRRLTEILKSIGLLPSLSKLLNQGGEASAVRTVLHDRCPLCDGALSGHRYGVFASIKIDGSRVIDRQNARKKVLTEPVDFLPAEGANEPMSDVVWYALLVCPIRRVGAVMEHFSEGDVYGEESAVMVRDIDNEALNRYGSRVYSWLIL